MSLYSQTNYFSKIFLTCSDLFNIHRVLRYIIEMASRRPTLKFHNMFKHVVRKENQLCVKLNPLFWGVTIERKSWKLISTYLHAIPYLMNHSIHIYLILITFCGPSWFAGCLERSKVTNMCIDLFLWTRMPFHDQWSDHPK